MPGNIYPLKFQNEYFVAFGVCPIEVFEYQVNKSFFL